MTGPDRLWIDLETYSETPIKHGTYRYAEDSEVMLILYAVNEGDPRCYDLTNPTDSAELHPELFFYLDNPDVELYGHGTMFDRTVLNYAGRYTTRERWRDTMVQAYCHALPGSLDKLCELFSLSEEFAKKKEGRDLIQLFCKPRPKNTKIRRATRLTHPEEWALFIEYGLSDIRACRELNKRMPKYNYPEGPSGELAKWHMDQRINDMGFCVDVDFVDAALNAVKDERKDLRQETVILTEGEVTSATRRDQVLEYILEHHGIAFADLKKGNVDRHLSDPDLPRAVKELLTLRLKATATSASKYLALRKAVNDDGRCRGTIQFGGAARTLRASGRTFQPQNLPSRGLMDEHQVEFGIEAIHAGVHKEFFGGDVMLLLTSCVRGVLKASPGRKLVVADLSNIEGRMASWVSGEEWKLQAFRDFDKGTGPDLYNLAYANAFRIRVEDVKKPQRAIGKVMELACLHPDTLVLTDSGAKRIVEVLLTDKLWDGAIWVTHDGLVARGVRKVVNVASTGWLTPDHLVLTKGTWRQVRQLVSSESTLCRALETGSEGLRLLDTITQLRVRSLIGCLRVANVVRKLRSVWSICAQGGLLNAASAGSKAKDAIGSTYTVTKTLYPTNGNGLGCSRGCPPLRLDATLRVPDNTKPTAGGGSTSAKSGAATQGLSLSTSSLSLAGAILKMKWTARTIAEGMSRVISALSLSSKITRIVELYKDCKNESTTWSPVYDIANAGANNRFTIITAEGALVVHNCGYAGGVGAFVTMALGYGFDLEQLAEDNWDTLPEAQLKEANQFYAYVIKKNMSTFGLSKEAFMTCDVFKRLWREANSHIAFMWKALEHAITEAINDIGTVYEAGPLIKVRCDKNWLRIRLPSGRYLCYANPRVDEGDSISYMGLNNYTRKWQRLKGYGGLFLENICQAASRDILYDAKQPAWDNGYQTVLHVHDELVTETLDSSNFSPVILSNLMTTSSSWTAGLPLAAAGFEGYRYRK